MKAIVIIPARYESSRFPGKPLAQIDGESMISRVYHRVDKVQSVDVVYVATDDKRIEDHVLSFGGNVIMTNSNHLTGTSRCIEVARALPEYEIVVNVQGDEPLIPFQLIEELVEKLKSKPNLDIITAVRKIDTEEEWKNPNVVKAVLKSGGEAMYFSRQAIPYHRDSPHRLPDIDVYAHIGIYGFRRKVLLALPEDGRLSNTEKLEQLAWLENGYSIHSVLTNYRSIGVDMESDIVKVEKLLKKFN